MESEKWITAKNLIIFSASSLYEFVLYFTVVSHSRVNLKFKFVGGYNYCVACYDIVGHFTEIILRLTMPHEVRKS